MKKIVIPLFLTVIIFGIISLYREFNLTPIHAQQNNNYYTQFCDQPPFDEFRTQQNSISTIWQNFQSETNKLEKIRFIAGLILTLRPLEEGMGKNNSPEIIIDLEFRRAACQTYLLFQQNIPRYFPDTDSINRLQNWLLNQFVADIGNDPTRPDVLSTMITGKYFDNIVPLNEVFDTSFPYSSLLHFELSNYFASLNPAILRNRQLSTLAQVFLQDSLDSSEGGKLKIMMLNRLKTYAVNYPQLEGCDLLQPYVTENVEILPLLSADMNPARLEQLKNSIQSLNLSCLTGSFVNPYSDTLTRWQTYLDFLEANQDVFTSPPQVTRVLDRFLIETNQIDGRTIYGSSSNPLNSKEKFWAVIALETYEIMQAYTFPPSKGHQNYTNEVLTNHNNPMDYVVYPVPPTLVNWVPNMQDYLVEQPNRGTYLAYLLAHEDFMKQVLEPSVYNLPLPQFRYRTLMITDRDFLKQLSIELAGQITGFSNYALPDISQTDIHNWKIQTIGPVIPGTRQGILSAEDTWRGTCGTTPQSNPYQYLYNGTTYCIDTGGIHERGHLSYGMGDLYWYNTTDFFWNIPRTQPLAIQRCELFKSLQVLSPYTMTTSIADGTVSTWSNTTRFTPFDWEYMHYKSFPTLFHSPLQYDMNHSIIFRVIIPPIIESVRKSSLNSRKPLPLDPAPYVLDVYMIQNNQSSLLHLGTATAQVGANSVDVSVLLSKLNQYANVNNLIIHTRLGTSATPDIVIFPIYMLEHIVFMHQRSGLTNQNYVIPITFYTNYRPPGSSLGPIDCTTPEGITAAANVYYPNRLAMVGGITSDLSGATNQLHPYVTVSLPLNMTYFFVTHNQNNPTPVFPSDWTGPMPSIGSNSID